MASYIKITSGGGTWYYTGSSPGNAYSGFQQDTGKSGNYSVIDYNTFASGLRKFGYNPPPEGTVGPATPAAAAPAPAPAAAAASGPQQTIDDYIEAIKKPAQDAIDFFKKLYVDDPFAVDKAMTDAAKKSATDKFDPEYQRKLSEFVSDIGVSLSSFESKQKLVDELSGATTGIAGASARQYQQAREAALQGFVDAGTFFSGTKERALGRAEVERTYQLGTAAENLQRQQTEWEKSRQETIATQSLREINKSLGKEGLTKAMTSFERYLPKTQAEVQSGLSNILNTYVPAIQGGSATLPQPYELSRNIGL